MEIKLRDYFSEEEIKEILEEELRNQISGHFGNERNAKRLLSNIAYQIVFDEADKIVGDSKQLVIDTTVRIINDIKSYSVFRDDRYGSAPSLGYKLIQDAVRDNRGMIEEQVQKAIMGRDYTEDVWTMFEQMGDNFGELLYKIAELGRNKVGETAEAKN